MRAVSLFSLDLWPEAFSASLSGSCCAYKHLRSNIGVGTTAIALAMPFCGSSLLLDASHIRIISGLGVVTFVLASGVMFSFATSWPLRNAG